MSASLETRAELLKLARVLSIDSHELVFLEEADPGELRELRASISDRLLARDREHFERIVTLGRHLPSRVAAGFTQHALGAQLSGRAASLLTADELAEFASRLPAEFVADVAAVMDLRSVGSLLDRIDTAKVVGVTRVLIERQDWVTMGAFGGRIGRDALIQVIGMLDGEALARVGFLLENRSRLDEIQGLLDDEKLQELLIAAGECDLIPETIYLVDALSDDSVVRVGRILGELNQERQEALAAILLKDASLLSAAQRLIDSCPPVRAAIDRARSQAA
ncbi:MAG: hypothetical protein ACXVBO_22745 [Isosphaeraceae bacterium]